MQVKRVIMLVYCELLFAYQKGSYKNAHKYQSTNMRENFIRVDWFI